MTRVAVAGSGGRGGEPTAPIAAAPDGPEAPVPGRNRTCGTGNSAVASRETECVHLPRDDGFDEGVR